MGMPARRVGGPEMSELEAAITASTTAMCDEKIRRRRLVVRLMPAPAGIGIPPRIALLLSLEFGQHEFLHLRDVFPRLGKVALVVAPASGQVTHGVGIPPQEAAPGAVHLAHATTASCSMTLSIGVPERRASTTGCRP